MAMNINGLTSGQTGTSKTRQNDGASEVGSPTTQKSGTESASESDVVQLSDRARILKSAGDTISQMPEIDQEKVDRIRSAIAGGDYKIDHEKLAAAFRRFESEL